MSEYFEVITNAVTGEQTIRPYTAAEIAAVKAARVPASVSPRQVRLLLLQQGLLSSVEAMIAARDAATRITWEYALEFRRDDPLLASLASDLGLTSEQVDDFFISASQL